MQTNDELVKWFEANGCTKTSARRPYSSNLIRCDCGRHAWAGAVCADPGDLVKLVAAAVSWAKVEKRPGRLRFLVGTGSSGRSSDAIHAIRLVRTERQLELLLDGEPAPAPRSGELFANTWLEEIAGRAGRKAPDVLGEIGSLTEGCSFAWYKNVTGGQWSGRIEGLQVCQLSEGGGSLTFGVGRPGEKEDSAARKAYFRCLATAGLSGASWSPPDGKAVAALIRRLARSGIAEFGSAEHRLEAEILAGRHVVVNGLRQPLKPVVLDGFPFQFPVRWWPKGRARYLDVLARHGNVPWALELKVDVNRGSYNRDGIIQAALYREAILRSRSLDDWFQAQGLDRKLVKAALLIPPLGEDEKGLELLADHRAVAKEFDVDLIIDERAAMKATVKQRT